MSCIRILYSIIQLHEDLHVYTFLHVCFSSVDCICVQPVEMNYGSSHVYMYESSDEDVISDEEFKEGMWLR